MTASDEYASVRYLVDDVQTAVDFYTTHLGFTLNTSAPAFADVVRGPLRLLLSGPASSGARATPDDATTAGRNRIHLLVDPDPGPARGHLIQGDADRGLAQRPHSGPEQQQVGRVDREAHRLVT